jgi:superfamily II DNA or RNA helicase
VVRVEILEPGCDGEFGGLCPGGKVYNLEVEGTHTYLAEGFVAHNCHTMPADTYYGVTRKCRSAYWRIGLSATPMDRGDRRSVFTMAALGTIIYELPRGLLVEQGVLARPKIRMVTVRQPKLTEYDGLTDQHLEVKDWPAVYEAQVVRSAVRNQAIVDVVRSAEKPCLLFVKSIKHGQLLVHALRAAGQQADFVYGTHGLQQRKTAMKELVRGQLDVLVASVIFNEGVDIPELRSVVIAAGGKSTIAALQRVGRGMRTSKDKTDFQVVDFRDLGTESLADQSRARRTAYLRAGYEVIQQ